MNCCCWQAQPIPFIRERQWDSDKGDDQPGEDVLSEVFFTGSLIIKVRGQHLGFLPEGNHSPALCPSISTSLKNPKEDITCVDRTAKRGGGTEKMAQ